VSAWLRQTTRWLPAALAALAVFLVVLWVWPRTDPRIEARVPGTDQAPDPGTRAAGSNPILRGTLESGPGKPGRPEGSWPQFRGVARDGAGTDGVPLSRSWSAGQPRELWSVKVGEGYAGAAVADGLVYLMDYDRDQQRDALRCLSLEDGREVWRFSYPIAIKRNHGMSRTVPAVASNRVVAIGPKCHVICVDGQTGALQWGIDMERQFGSTVPPWYTGQCPLIDDGRVILAPGGPEALLVAVDLETGEWVWTTPNPQGWRMTHSSVMVGEFAGRKMYIYCASGGVVGVDAQDGSVLWQTPDWRISIANVPSPVLLDDGRIFFSGGYNAGSLMLQLRKTNGSITPHELFRLRPERFGATQQTPIAHQGHLYGVRPDGQFVCLNLNGDVLWSSGPDHTFGLGPFLLADGRFYVLDDSGTLSMIEATPSGFALLGRTQVLQGREAWAPMAIAVGRLLARDLERMVCLEVH
jgi:outer membrane protein assembly factor BamB